MLCENISLMSQQTVREQRSVMSFHVALKFVAVNLALLAVSVAALANPTTNTAAGTASASSTSQSSLAAAPGSQDELQRWCDAVTRVLPKIKLKPCLRAGLSPTGAKSVKGVPILAREAAARKGQPSSAVRVLVVGGIHGDELTSSAIVFRWLEMIDDADAAAYHWQIVPLANPDGLLAKPPTRVNANGVDLNRNFPTPNWERDAQKYWAAKAAKDPRRFPGKSAMSEPESQWLHNEIKRFNPDVIVAIHAPFNLLDFDGPVDPPHKLGALVLMPVGIYPGSLGHYGGVHKGVPVVTIELPHALDMPRDAEVNSIWRDMLMWIENNIAKRKVQSAGGATVGVR
jgi:hypothetical protein